MPLKEANLFLEPVILLTGAMTLLISGILLFLASGGAFPYYENGLYGLILIIFALQMITLGQTPFGCIPRSKLVLAVAVMIAAVGFVTCFIPVSNLLSRMVLFLCLGPGGLFLLLEMCLSKDKLRVWWKDGGIFRHLILGCSGVYVLSMLTAILLWQRSLLATSMTAVLVFLFGAALFYLAWVLQVIYGTYPEAEKRPRGDVELSTEQAMLMLMGVFMVLLGVLLIPVSLGRLPFSGSAQLGLLMVIFAVQMLASGSTPIGPFSRSWLVIAFGFLFAALGIVSCIIPGILVPLLTVLVGVLNILGGVMALSKIGISRQQADQSSGGTPPIFIKLFVAQVTMNLLAIMFGASMLLPGLVPGLVIAVILAANGGVLLYLLRVLIGLDKIRGGTAGAV